MGEIILRMTLKSDGAFGSGSGMNSQIDMEVQHDQYGCPNMSGKTLKGLLAEECVNILFSLKKMGKMDGWLAVAEKMFGSSGSGGGMENTISFGNAELPDILHAAIRNEVKKGRIAPEEILKSLTAVRFQTALDFNTGTAKTRSLRSKRVILRETPFEARLTVDPTDPRTLPLLSACVLALRRVGMGRNRGTGELNARLYEHSIDVTENYYKSFIAEIGKKEGTDK